jgi:tRNA-2-methylthio-N6-dimethylallyladenosine synthase
MRTIVQVLSPPDGIAGDADAGRNDRARLPVATERLARLIDTVRRGSRERNMTLLGARRESAGREGREGAVTCLQARTRDFKTVLMPGDDSMIGRYLHCRAHGDTGSTFTGLRYVTIASERRCRWQD